MTPSECCFTHAKGPLGPTAQLGALRWRALPALRWRRLSLAAFRRPGAVKATSQYAAPNYPQQRSPAPQPAAAPAALAPVPVPAQQQQQRRPAFSNPDTVLLERSQIMGKEIITRTKGRRLGYINQMYVDPRSLSVVSVYLRREGLPLPQRASAVGGDHLSLLSFVQISDVVLVHDEQVLRAPPADESCGFYKLVGASVRTEDGVLLGKVRDYLFNPDDGRVSVLKYDAFGIPFIPPGLLASYQVYYDEVVAVGPAEVVVRSGAGARAIKEAEGLVSEAGVAALASILSRLAKSAVGLGADEAEAQAAAAVRQDPAYMEWLKQYGSEYEAYYGKAMLDATARVPDRTAPAQQQPAQQQPAQPQRAAAPSAQRALPPPRSTTFSQALQPAQPAGQQAWAAQVQPAREAVLAGTPQGGAVGGGGGDRAWPRPVQQQAAWSQGGLAEVQFPAQPTRQPPPQQPVPAAPQQQWQQPAPAAPAAARPPYYSPPAWRAPGTLAAQPPQQQQQQQLPQVQPPQQWAAGAAAGPPGPAAASPQIPSAAQPVNGQYPPQAAGAGASQVVQPSPAGPGGYQQGTWPQPGVGGQQPQPQQW